MLSGLETTLANFGLAGIVVGLFYALMRNELKDLKTTIEKLGDNIMGLTVELAKR